MRRTRIALVGAGAGALVVIAWFAWSPTPKPATATLGPTTPATAVAPAVVDPPTIPAVETPISGDPGPEVRAELLDQVQAYEVDRFGEAEAGRRRRMRERLLEGRIGR